MAIGANWKGKQFGVGDLVSVDLRLVEGGKERTQAYKGVVLSIGGHGENKTFLVRKEGAGGIGVERIFPLFSPWISDIRVIQKATHVKRAKLYYLRGTAGRDNLKRLYRVKEQKPVAKKRVVKKAVKKVKTKITKKVAAKGSK